MTGAAAIRDDFTASYTGLTLFLLVGPMVLALFVEAPLFLALERYPKAKTAAIALVVMAASSLFGAFAAGPWILALAIGLNGLASGVSTGIAQAALVDGDPEQRELRMAQWTLAGVLGDLTAPLLLGLAAFATFGWRGAMIAGAAVACVSAVQIARTPIPNVAEDEEEERPSLRVALGNRRLLAWLFASALCSLLDETLVAFAVLFVRDRLGGDLAAQGMVVAAVSIGDALGLLVLPHLLRRFRPITLILVTAAGSALAFGAWLASPSISWAIALMVATGIFTSPHYPLVKAQAYAALPGRSSMVNALNAMFSPIDLVAPLLLGMIADRFGILAAMGLLLIQPLGIFAVAAGQKRKSDA